MRPIHISLGPNYEQDDVWLAIKTLFNPLKWFDEGEVDKLEKEFEEKLPGGYSAIAVNSGRSAEYIILNTLDVGRGDEVIVQEFTCIAVPNSASWLGAKPIFVGMGKDYNIDTFDLKKKITNKTKAIIVQNTFGIPADYKKVQAVSGSIEVIEDCAHALGVKVNGNIAFFSFGRDKIISSVFGGMIATRDIELFSQLKKRVDELKSPPLWWTIQQLMHPILLSVILPTYSLGLGKLMLLTFQKLNILSRAVYPEEKKGGQPKVFPAKMPPALAVLARHQLKKLNRFNEHRQKIARYYFDNLPKVKLDLPAEDRNSVWLRFPVRVKDGPGLLNFAKQKHIILGDWYKSLDLNVINLPTYPTMTIDDAKKVVEVVTEWLNTQPA